MAWLMGLRRLTGIVRGLRFRTFRYNFQQATNSLLEAHRTQRKQSASSAVGIATFRELLLGFFFAGMCRPFSAPKQLLWLGSRSF